MISTNFISDLQQELEQRRSESEMIKDQLKLYDIKIDRYDSIIDNMDKFVLPLIDEINNSIDDVKTAYDNRISAGCRSDLAWVLVGTSQGQTSGGETYTINTYQVQKNSAVRIDYNKWGAKYYRRPQNQDYGANIVKEIIGSAGIGATNLAVTSIGGTGEIIIGDTITDNIDNPSIFSGADLPDVVGFGVSSIIINQVDYGGYVAFGSTVVVNVGVGSTSGINIGDTIVKSGVLTPGTTVVDISTGTYPTQIWDFTTGGFISTNITAPALIISSPATGTATTTFEVGITSEFPSLLLDKPTNYAANNAFFTVIRSTQSQLTSFDYTNNPLDPVTIGILDQSTTGLGHSLVRVNNGSPVGPFQWREVLGGFDPEPACGNSFARYYSGNYLWPGYITYTYNASGVAIASTFFYADEGYTVSVGSSVGVGSTGPASSVSIAYTGTSTINPSVGSCNILDSAISSAESTRDSIISTNQPKIDDVINSSAILRTLRNRLEAEAFSLLQGKVYSEVESNRINQDIRTLQSLDFTPFEPQKLKVNNKFSTDETGTTT